MISPTPSHLEVWVDPSCPWAWQTAKWLRSLRDRGILSIDWSLFSLEVNASEPGAGLWGDHRRYGDAHTALMLAHRDGGNPRFERLYFSLGHRLHDLREEVSSDTLLGAATDAGMPDVAERATRDPSLAHDVLDAHDAARSRDVFGVPSLSVDGAKPIFGPILSLAPEGDDALTWWDHVGFLARRPDFFELKRWPRHSRPGASPRTR